MQCKAKQRSAKSNKRSKSMQSKAVESNTEQWHVHVELSKRNYSLGSRRVHVFWWISLTSIYVHEFRGHMAFTFPKALCYGLTLPQAIFCFPEMTPRKNKLAFFRALIDFVNFYNFFIKTRFWGLHFLVRSVLRGGAPAGAFLFPKNDT